MTREKYWSVALPRTISHIHFSKHLLMSRPRLLGWCLFSITQSDSGKHTADCKEKTGTD